MRYKSVTVDTTITSLIEFAQTHGTTYKMLKIMNPWLLKDELVVGRDAEGNPKSYTIKIPKSAKSPPGADTMLPDSMAPDTSMVTVSDSLVDTAAVESTDGLVPQPEEVPQDSSQKEE